KLSSAPPHISSSQARMAPSPLGSISYTRRVPAAVSRTSPAALSTARCWDTAGRDTVTPRASSPTARGPDRSRSNSSRRVGSARAARAVAAEEPVLLILSCGFSQALGLRSLHARTRAHPCQPAFQRAASDELLALGSRPKKFQVWRKHEVSDGDAIPGHERRRAFQPRELVDANACAGQRFRDGRLVCRAIPEHLRHEALGSDSYSDGWKHIPVDDADNLIHAGRRA